MTEAVLSNRALNRALLARQMLLEREEETPVRAIERLVGMQAQIPKPPFLGLWSRLSTFRREDLVRAFEKKRAVRSTTMRATIHVLSTKDYVAFRNALQPALDRAVAAILKNRLKGIDLASMISEARAVFDAKPCTFDALRDHFLEVHPKLDTRAIAYAVRCMLPLVQLPTEAIWSFPGNADFAVAESWLGERVDRGDPDPKPLVLRYLAAFGPATPADAQTWSGLPSLKSTFEALRPKLRVFRDTKKRELFDLPSAPRPDEDTKAPVRFLPEFDNILLSHADRSRIVADVHRSKVFSANLRVVSTVLVDGFVAGTYSIARTKKAATLAIVPFESFSKKARDELVLEGDALLRFVEQDAGAFEVRFEKAR